VQNCKRILLSLTRRTNQSTYNNNDNDEIF